MNTRCYGRKYTDGWISRRKIKQRDCQRDGQMNNPNRETNAFMNK